MTGDIISHYRILEKLGEGGMGVVYKAEDRKLKRTVALKFLPPEFIRDLEAKERFLHEAQAAASLSHSNICTIYEIDESEGQMYIAMEYIKGQSLHDVVGLRQSVPLSLDDVINYTTQIAEGLREAHEKGIIHRDIKPANIMITAKGQIRIMDFGLAKLRGRTKLTKPGTTMGTVAYMSPEQAKGEDVDHRTDIWSLGVVLYEMITGQMPFKGGYDQAVIYSILNEEPDPVTESRPEIQVEFGSIVKKALAKNPDERYQQTSDILTDLNSLKRKIELNAMKEHEMDTERIPSIAVLPFVNMSSDPENEYFGDGLAEELINALTRLKGLRVAARTSAFCFKGRESDIREIGRQLNVNTILEGSVRKAGNRLRVTAQLINIEDGYHLWSERYDREMEDIFAIQDEITAAIVEQLEVKLVKRVGEPLVKRYTDNLDAYSQYLKGRYYWNLLTAEGWQKSFECYQKAIEIDPNYALAYVGLAMWHGSQAFWGEIPPKQVMPKLLEYIQKVNDLDNTISDAHILLATYYAAFDLNWPAANREFKRALELEPTNAFGLVNYALCLSVWRKFDEALVYARRAEKLDPLSSINNTWIAEIFLYAGQNEEAIERLKQVITKDPGYWQPYLWLSFALISQSRMDEAIPEAEKAVELSGGASIATTILSCAYFLSGRSKEGEEQVNSLLERSQRTYVPCTFFVWIHNTRNDIDEAFRCLQKAAEERDTWILFNGLKPDALWTDDPQFNELLKKIGIEV